MFEEKPDHLTGRVWSSRFGTGTGGAASGPCMACAMQFPVFQHRMPAFIALNRAGVSYSPGGVAAADVRLEDRPRLRLNNDVSTVGGMHGRVAVAMEHDRRQRRADAAARRFAARVVQGFFRA